MSEMSSVLPELTPEQAADLKRRWEAMYKGIPETEVRLTLCFLYSLPGGIIAGDAEGKLYWVSTEDIVKADWRADVTIIPSMPGSNSLTVPVLKEGLFQPYRSPETLDEAAHAENSWDREEIPLRPIRIGDWLIFAGYGPKSRTWYVSPEAPKHID